VAVKSNILWGVGVSPGRPVNVHNRLCVMYCLQLGGQIYDKQVTSKNWAENTRITALSLFDTCFASERKNEQENLVTEGKTFKIENESGFKSSELFSRKKKILTWNNVIK
jgi:hypothetical protein